jgi:hypothetical protein
MKPTTTLRDAVRRSKAESIEVRDLLGPDYSRRRRESAIGNPRKKLAAIVAAAGAAVVALSGCSEIDQTAKTQKVYAGKKDERPYDSKEYSADKNKWEVALKERGKGQNEYLRTEPAK